MKTGKGPARKTARGAARTHDDLVDALGRAGWAEADAALASALAEWAVLERGCARVLRRRAGAKTLAKVKDGMAQMRQALARAARKRGLDYFGEAGAKAVFDPERHALDRPAKRAPGKVVIKAPGVARGGEVVIKARVALKKKPAKKKKAS